MKKILKKVERKVFEFTTFSEFVSELSLYYKDDIAFIDEKTKRTITYKKFYKDVLKFSTYLNNIFGKNNNIILKGKNCYEWFLSFVSIVCSGNVVVPLEFNENDSMLKKFFTEVEATCIITDQLVDDIILDVQHIYMLDIDGVINAQTNYSEFKNQQGELAAILYTSGTLSKSKGVMLSQKNILSNLKSCCDSQVLYGTTIAFLHFNHMFSILTVLAGLYYGVQFIISDIGSLINNIIKYEPSYLCVVPSVLNVFESILEDRTQREINDYFFGHNKLDFCICGGAPLSKYLIKKFLRINIKIYNGYGITECSPVVSLNDLKTENIDSVGKPLVGVDVKIDDIDDNGVGEICVRGDSVMLGYYKNISLTKAAIIDGWFHTGDLGKVDEEGYLYILGRKKNLIILNNGKKIYPELLEGMIEQIECVQSVKVYLEKNTITAEIYVTLSVENEKLIYQKIQKINDLLPNYKRIKNIKLREKDFEKTTLNKIIRYS